MGLKFLTVNQVAEKLQCSLATIYRYVANRTIPHIKQGHRLMFVESEIDAWMKSMSVPVITKVKDETYLVKHKILNNGK